MHTRRKIIHGARYRIFTRTNHLEAMLSSEEEKTEFTKIIEQALAKFNFRIDTLVITATQVVFIIEPLKGESLSKIMQWILGVFAQAYNRRHKLVGHFWADRFASTILNSLQQFLLTCIEIEDKPVKEGLCNKPEEWKYSGAYHRINGLKTFIDWENNENYDPPLSVICTAKY